MQFEYPEDREFFAQLLTSGDEKKLEEEFSDYFDFRHPAIKRWEFNKTKKKALDALTQKHDGKCQLRIHPDCSKDGKFEPDHIIPLSTNELNKKLRRLTRTAKEKVVAQSFGSNDLKNLTLACKRCNALKKHRIILPRGAFSSDPLQLFERRIEDEIFPLPSNKFILVPKYSVHLKQWHGAPLKETFGGKPVLDVDDKPMFAELAIMNLFIRADWQARWVETYGKSKNAPIFLSEWKDDKYKNQVPDPIVDKKISDCLASIAALSENSYGGCWDVLAWKDDILIFAESKRLKRDSIRQTQINWLTASLAYGLKPENFAMIEWVIE